MKEFVGRWGVVGVAVWAFLHWALGLGGRGVLGSESVGGILPLAALWVGFVNALIRPVFLEACGMRLRGGFLFVGLLAVVAAVNGVVFGFLGVWEPALGRVVWGDRVVGALVAGAFSAAVSSVFYSRDGRWHWITYHGRRDEKRHRARTASGGSTGGSG